MEDKNKNKIFKYNDGFGDVFGDPSEIDYRMSIAEESVDMTTIGSWLKLPTDAEGNVLEEDRITPLQRRNFKEACHRMLPIIRAMFDVKPFDKTTGEGLTMDDLLGLWARYMGWRSDVKKNTGDSPTDVTPMDFPETSSATSPGQRNQSKVPGPGTGPGPVPIPPLPRPRSVFTGLISTPAGVNPSSEPSSSGLTSS